MACTPTQMKLCGNIDCAVCFERSLASTIYAKLLCADGNEGYTPYTIHRNSNKKFWFTCPNTNCTHRSLRDPSHLMRSFTKGCSYCKAGTFAKLCDDNSCAQCYERSLASTGFADSVIPEWNNGITARQIRRNSQDPIWIKCTTCGHKIRKTPAKIGRRDGCQYCTRGISGTVCGNIDCQQCFKRSFASHEKAQYWDYEANGDAKPIDVCFSSSRIFTFICPFCTNPYISSLGNITVGGNWCGCLLNKTERKLHAWLCSTYPEYTFVREFRIKSLSRRRFDFFIKELDLIIELDGKQHFSQVSNWKPAVHTQQIDSYKALHAISAGYTVIRILQEDVWHDRNGWEAYLSENIRKYDKPRYVIPKHAQYDSHRECWTRIITYVKWKRSGSNTEYNSINEILKLMNIRSNTFVYDDGHFAVAIDMIRETYALNDIDNREVLIFFLTNVLHHSIEFDDKEQWTFVPILE